MANHRFRVDSLPNRFPCHSQLSRWQWVTFLNDRHAVSEISVLTSDGLIELLRRSDLDTRPYTPEEQTERLRGRLNTRPEPEAPASSGPSQLDGCQANSIQESRPQRNFRPHMFRQRQLKICLS